MARVTHNSLLSGLSGKLGNITIRQVSGQMQDPAAKALYTTGITVRKTSARTVAISDFMRGPVITATDLSNYHGQAGDSIRIWATDNFAVTAVQVRLYAATGALMAQGPATPEPGGSWLFQAAVASTDWPGTRIEVEAQDRPGNLTSQSYILQSGLPGGWAVAKPPEEL
ncbi:hypothetical protein [Hymenobacter lucidus]|uniref:Uncharacterized protein n=1 Tax=Hymenobacter lucidus TaxID=2880930 RepID=A0ABS8AN99_9BACT|nr:hypothetical protein [Hymenobacter lucidus]MCB2407663.1 hypothetical protein [Hymenobacter lucidus]